MPKTRGLGVEFLFVPHTSYTKEDHTNNSKTHCCQPSCRHTRLISISLCIYWRFIVYKLHVELGRGCPQGTVTTRQSVCDGPMEIGVLLAYKPREINCASRHGTVCLKCIAFQPDICMCPDPNVIWSQHLSTVNGSCAQAKGVVCLVPGVV